MGWLTVKTPQRMTRIDPARLAVFFFLLFCGWCGRTWCAPAEDSPAVKNLRDFFQTPPVIKNMIVGLKVPVLNPVELYLEISSQRDAFLLRCSDRLSDLTNSSTLPHGDANVLGHFGNQYWIFEGQRGELVTDTLTADFARSLAQTNRIEALYEQQMPLSIFSSIISRLGLQLPPAPVRWDANTLHGTNDRGAAFAAVLRVGTNGLPLGFSVDYPLGIDGSPSGTNFHLNVGYGYSNSIPGWSLPTSIFWDGDVTIEIHILSIDVASRPQEFWAFHYAPFMHPNGGVSIVAALTNATPDEVGPILRVFDPAQIIPGRHSYDDERDGWVRYFNNTWMPKSETKRNY